MKFLNLFIFPCYIAFSLKPNVVKPLEKRWISFNDKVSCQVKSHPIVMNNDYLNFFSQGQITVAEQKYFTQQFSVFSQLFLLAQLTKVINAPSLEEMRDSKEILCNELGVNFRSDTDSIQNGIYRHQLAHFEWLLEFAQVLGLEFNDLGKRNLGSKTTLFFCDELLRLYGSSNDNTALAASYAIENWANKSDFWKQLITGFSKINEIRDYNGQKSLPLSFWKFHYELEKKHAKHTEEELKTVFLQGRINDEELFLETCTKMLDAVEIFWDGLDFTKVSEIEIDWIDGGSLKSNNTS
jgi:hypothetical protein